VWWQAGGYLRYGYSVCRGKLYLTKELSPYLPCVSVLDQAEPFML